MAFWACLSTCSFTVRLHVHSYTHVHAHFTNLVVYEWCDSILRSPHISHFSFSPLSTCGTAKGRCERKQWGVTKFVRQIDQVLDKMDWTKAKLCISQLDLKCSKWQTQLQQISLSSAIILEDNINVRRQERGLNKSGLCGDLGALP